MLILPNFGNFPKISKFSKKEFDTIITNCNIKLTGQTLNINVHEITIYRQQSTIVYSTCKSPIEYFKKKSPYSSCRFLHHDIKVFDKVTCFEMMLIDAIANKQEYDGNNHQHHNTYDHNGQYDEQQWWNIWLRRQIWQLLLNKCNEISSNSQEYPWELCQTVIMHYISLFREKNDAFIMGGMYLPFKRRAMLQLTNLGNLGVCK